MDKDQRKQAIKLLTDISKANPGKVEQQGKDLALKGPGAIKLLEELSNDPEGLTTMAKLANTLHKAGIKKGNAELADMGSVSSESMSVIIGMIIHEAQTNK